MWKRRSQIFIVYLNFNTPDSSLKTFDEKWFMRRTNFVKFDYRGYWELKTSNYIH